MKDRKEDELTQQQNSLNLKVAIEPIADIEEGYPWKALYGFSLPPKPQSTPRFTRKRLYLWIQLIKQPFPMDQDNVSIEDGQATKALKTTTHKESFLFEVDDDITTLEGFRESGGNLDVQFWQSLYPFVFVEISAVAYVGFHLAFVRLILFLVIVVFGLGVDAVGRLGDRRVATSVFRLYQEIDRA